MCIASRGCLGRLMGTASMGDTSRTIFVVCSSLVCLCFCCMFRICEGGLCIYICVGIVCDTSIVFSFAVLLGGSVLWCSML